MVTLYVWRNDDWTVLGKFRTLTLAESYARSSGIARKDFYIK